MFWIVLLSLCCSCGVYTSDLTHGQLVRDDQGLVSSKDKHEKDDNQQLNKDDNQRLDNLLLSEHKIKRVQTLSKEEWEERQKDTADDDKKPGNVQRNSPLLIFRLGQKGSQVQNQSDGESWLDGELAPGSSVSESQSKKNNGEKEFIRSDPFGKFDVSRGEMSASSGQSERTIGQDKRSNNDVDENEKSLSSEVPLLPRTFEGIFQDRLEKSENCLQKLQDKKEQK